MKMLPSYDTIMNLKEKDYPKYLKEIYYQITGEKLNLKNPKNFNEKIQWLKIYDATPLKTKLTDKILVRDWIREKLSIVDDGEKYLKPVLQISKSFDDINFDDLPEKFIIKTNHGSKWHYIIKDKKGFLQNKVLFNTARFNFIKWLNLNFFGIGGMELQYKNIIPAILIEPLLRDSDKDYSEEIEVYCFNSQPLFCQRIKYSPIPETCVYTNEFKQADFLFHGKYNNVFIPADDLLKTAVKLSKTLAEGFIFVRIDWLVYNKNIYFNEMTFTPFSGYKKFIKNTNDFLGSFINIDLKKGKFKWMKWIKFPKIQRNLKNS